MTIQTTAMSVFESVVVEVPIEHAFSVFTEGMQTWWPPDHHLLEAPLAEMVIEPQVGGRIFDRGTDGSECHWATVSAWDPPTFFAFAWCVDVQWQVETDPRRCSEVEVRFVAESPERTRVELEHRHLDRHGDGWEGMRDAVGSPNGWAAGLRNFADRTGG